MNERDNLGDDLVPDYATSVKDGGFYGWPYSYIGKNPDPRYLGAFPDLVNRAIVPDVLLPAHSAALGLTFYDGNQFPQRYRNGAFVALHGSWNRSVAAGYKVVFVPMVQRPPRSNRRLREQHAGEQRRERQRDRSVGPPGGGHGRTRRLAAGVRRWFERDLEGQREKVTVSGS
jgi:glucose/arabinose dehydrogenase